MVKAEERPTASIATGTRKRRRTKRMCCHQFCRRTFYLRKDSIVNTKTNVLCKQCMRHAPKEKGITLKKGLSKDGIYCQYCNDRGAE